MFRADVRRRADELGIQPLRWPEPFPFDSDLAMRVATYAKGIGRVVPFAQAAFRQAFAAGRSLSDPDTVLIAAAACEMHPQAVLRGAELPLGARAACEPPPRRRLERASATFPRCWPIFDRTESGCWSASAHWRRRGSCWRAPPRDEGQPRLPADRQARRLDCPRCWPTPLGSITSRWWRSTAARWCCSGTSIRRRRRAARERCAPTWHSSRTRSSSPAGPPWSIDEHPCRATQPAGE